MPAASNFNKKVYLPKILICPLDWGLGHATRCIPIINELLDNNCTVIIAAQDKILKLLKLEFPELQFIPLPGYNIKYSKHKNMFKWKLLFQLPRIIYAIFYEHRWLKKVIKIHEINAVISDNRPGLYNKSVPCIYITHQLQIKAPEPFIQKCLFYIHRYFIKKYHQCWVPDSKEDGIGGSLSHPEKVIGNVTYLGPVSRLSNLQQQTVYDHLFLLSGPEPQRTKLEDIIIANSKSIKGNNLLIRGTDQFRKLFLPSNFEIIDLVASDQLNKLMNASSIIISRSGYSTIMDLIKLNKKALLIPTPGQTEQEYLAQYLHQKNMFCCIQQSEQMDINIPLSQFNQWSPEFPEYNWQHYKEVIQNFIASLHH